MSTTTDTDTITTDEWQPPRGSFLGDTWVNFKRWMRKIARTNSLLVAMITQPVIWLILFTEVFQSIVQLPGFEYESYLAFFLPTVLIFMAQFSSGAAGISLLVDIESGMVEKILATPVSRSAVFVGKSLAELLRIVIQVLIVLVMGYALGARIEAGLLGALGLLGVALLYGIFFLTSRRSSGCTPKRARRLKSFGISSNFHYSS